MQIDSISYKIRSSHINIMSCKAQDIADLFTYFETDPCIQSCYKRMMNVVMTEECTIKENNRIIKPELSKILNKHYHKFVFDAMKMAYICGFVPFYITRHNDLRIPIVMVAGSFSWSVELCGKYQKRRKFEIHDKCSRYLVHVHTNLVKESDVHVINFSNPVLHNDGKTCYPIMALYRLYMQLQDVQKIIQEANLWNKDKHVAITEQFDLKDQTTSGIELLDEVRRYTLTGQSGIAPIVRMRRAHAGSASDSTLHSVNDANMHWLSKQFEGGDDGKSAKFHLLPANMNLSELNTISVGTELQVLIANYRTSVHDFFDMPNTEAASSKGGSVIGSQLSRQQYNQVLATNKFVESMLETAYRLQFNLDETVNVDVRLHPQSRLEINNFADIKAVSEIEGFLSGGEKQQIKDLFLKK